MFKLSESNHEDCCLTTIVAFESDDGACYDVYVVHGSDDDNVEEIHVFVHVSGARGSVRLYYEPGDWVTEDGTPLEDVEIARWAVREQVEAELGEQT